MKNIKRFSEFNENSTIFSDADAYGGNSLFKIKIRPLGDLSGNKGKGEPEPTRAFSEGDIVRGIDEEGRKEHKGSVISVKFDEESDECTAVSIEEHGQKYNLVPSSVKMVKDNGSDNDEEEDEATHSVNTNQPNVSSYTFESIDTFDKFIAK